MQNNRKIKFTKQLRDIHTKLRWQVFSEIQDYKLTSDYIDMLMPSREGSSAKTSSTEALESIVRESLIKEFSPKIQDAKCYNLLVDAVMSRLQKKATK